MKIIYFIIIVLSVSLSLTFHQTFALNIVEPLTPEEVLDKFDLVVLGTVTNVENLEEDKPTIFQINIEEIMNKPDSFDDKNLQTIDAIGCTSKEKKNDRTLVSII